MRIGLLGQVGDDTPLLGDVVRFCIGECAADTLFYLGNEPAVLELLQERRRELESEPVIQSLWERSTRCVEATAAELEAFVSEQRLLRAFLQVELLGSSPARRLFSSRGQSWLLCSDRDEVEPQFLMDAELVASGTEKEALIDVVGGQVVVAPGSFPAGGLLILDDSQGLSVQSFDAACRRLSEERIALSELPPPVEQASPAAS